MAITISPDILARINAAVEAEGFPDADALLDHLLTPLEAEELDPESIALIQEGLDDFENGRYEVLTDEVWEDIRHEAHERFLRGERAGAHVRP